MASPLVTSAGSNGPKFKLFSRARGRSPAPHKREPPPGLTLGPSRAQDHWEADSDGETQEFHSQELHEPLGLNAPLSSVRTAPPTLVHAPSPLYPQYPQTAIHTTQFLVPSPHIQQTQHPFSANYEGRSQESERDEAVGNLRRARDANRRRAVWGLALDKHDGQIRAPFRGRSDSQDTVRAPSPATPSPDVRGSPHARIEEGATGEEVDLDVYPWFIFLHGGSEHLVDAKRTDLEGQGLSFISLH